MINIGLSLLKRPWLFIYFGCFIAFLCQLFSLIHSYVHPSQTVTRVEKKDLNNIPFPVLFKICIKPGFDGDELLNAGYLHAGRYFLGESRFNSSVHGWAGHLPDGRIKGNVSGRVCLQILISLIYLKVFRKRCSQRPVVLSATSWSLRGIMSGFRFLPQRRCWRDLTILTTVSPWTSLTRKK